MTTEDLVFDVAVNAFGCAAPRGDNAIGRMSNNRFVDRVGNQI